MAHSNKKDSKQHIRQNGRNNNKKRFEEGCACTYAALKTHCTGEIIQFSAGLKPRYSNSHYLGTSTTGEKGKERIVFFKNLKEMEDFKYYLLLL